MQATEYSSLIDSRVFHLVGEVADSMGRECYVVGGYVRDLIIHRHSKDIDFVTIGAGIEVAQAVAARLGNKSHLAVYRNFGTAQIHCGDDELEFVAHAVKAMTGSRGNRSWRTGHLMTTWRAETSP